MMSAAVVRNHSSRSHDHKRGVNRLPDESNSPLPGVTSAARTSKLEVERPGEWLNDNGISG